MYEAWWWEHCLTAYLPYSTIGKLTVIALIAHDLAASVFIADGKAGAVGLNITLGSGIPMDPCDADRPRHIHQAMQGHLHLNANIEERNCSSIRAI